MASQSEAYEFRHKFDSKHGDAFTLYSAYNEWLKVVLLSLFLILFIISVIIVIFCNYYYEGEI
jgi:hypothetical protein